MSVFDFFENHIATHGPNRVRIAGPFSYELDAVGSAFSALLAARHERDFTDKRGLRRSPREQAARNHRVDRACDGLRGAVARMAKVHPEVAALCYRELLADDEAEYQALLERATTDYGRRAITDSRRALARTANKLANERDRP